MLRREDEGEETIGIERGKAVEEIPLDGTGERTIAISLMKEGRCYSIVEASTRVHGEQNGCIDAYECVCVSAMECNAMPCRIVHSNLAGLYLSTHSLSSMLPPFCTVAAVPRL